MEVSGDIASHMVEDKSVGLTCGHVIYCRGPWFIELERFSIFRLSSPIGAFRDCSRELSFPRGYVLQESHESNRGSSPPNINNLTSQYNTCLKLSAFINSSQPPHLIK